MSNQANDFAPMPFPYPPLPQFLSQVLFKKKAEAPTAEVRAARVTVEPAPVTAAPQRPANNLTKPGPWPNSLSELPYGTYVHSTRGPEVRFYRQF